MFAGDSPIRKQRPAAAAFGLLALAFLGAPAGASERETAFRFDRDIEPILAEHCITCHGGDEPKAGVAFDRFGPGRAAEEDRELWWKALKQLRAGLMPPGSRRGPDADQLRQIEGWVKSNVFRIDPDDPDPGRVTVRRLNRTEYRNTVRDLIGVDYDTGAEFPPDDTGHGFDTIGDVLTVSPLLLEKYLDAAKTIISEAVPTAPKVVAEHPIPGARFRRAGEGGADGGEGRRGGRDGRLTLSYYEPASATAVYRAEHAGRYQLVLDLSAHERFVDGVFDYNRCRLTFFADGKKLLEREFSRQGGKSYRFTLDQEWQPGEHTLAFELEPLTPGERQVRSLNLRVNSVTVRGPLEEKYWVRPPNHERFFPKPVPESAAGRRAYARELLGDFARRAFRRPVDDRTLDRLVALAEVVYRDQGQPFEAGVARAMTAVLASPRFLFREEGVKPAPPGRHPFIDEYALASRLSYFLWSSMPDEELFRLAAANKLRANLKAQLGRMLADPRAEAFLRNFPGQWLQARDIETVPVNAFAVLSADRPPDPDARRRRERFRELRRKPPEKLTEAEKKELEELRGAFSRSFRRFREFELDGELRRAMRRETEMLFGHIVREDRSLLELIDADYTFLNERLAKHYGIEGVEGDEMRRVALPPDSPRGGVLTQGTVLAVTSNPDRTSPVKRGLFILDNILGTPPAPPPPDIPPLEEAARELKGRTPTLRETLELHRRDALCASCHNRMDPLGLALENFNALGMWRDTERGQPIDSKGKLITGESFGSVRELKKILATEHRRDFYRCLTEKMLTYALGRGLDYYDVHAVDAIVERVERANGRASALLEGIVESAPFQKRRKPEPPDTSETPGPRGREPG